MAQNITRNSALVLRRASAYVLDIVVLFFVLAPLGFLIQMTFGLALPETGPEIWRTLLLNFSLPVWIYFAWSDRSGRGATVGKRIFNLQVKAVDGAEITWGTAFLRTAVKLLPWELVHLSAFALSADMTQFTGLQLTGMILSNLLSILYVVLFVVTQGQRSVHDFAAQTLVIRR